MSKITREDLEDAGYHKSNGVWITPSGDMVSYDQAVFDLYKRRESEEDEE